MAKTYAAISGLTDIDFNEYTTTFKIPDSIQLVSAGECGFEMSKKGCHTICTFTPSSNFILMPVHFDHSKLKNIREADHYGLLSIKVDENRCVYHDGRILESTVLSKDTRYTKIKSNLIPLLNKKFGWNLSLVCHRFSSPLRYECKNYPHFFNYNSCIYYFISIPNGCSFPVFYSIQRIAASKEVKTPSQKENWIMLQKIGHFFRNKIRVLENGDEEPIGYSMKEWNLLK